MVEFITVKHFTVEGRVLIVFMMSCTWEDDGFLDFKELEEQITQFVDKSELEEMFRLQILEFEMLQSMFSNPGEFEVHDHSVIADINDFVEGKTSILPPYLDFTINLTIDNYKFQVCVNLPHDYPADEPDIFVRCDNLTRNQQHLLNKDLCCYVTKLDRGEICIYSAVSWLQENASAYCVSDTKTKTKCNNSLVSNRNSNDKLFSRYWIYSHHIYSKMKRKCIMDYAHEYNVTGFCLPGRPGIICAEGWESDCSEWWQKIRCMNWKKIMCKKKEEVPITDSKNIDSFRKFISFQEISFDGGKSKGRECHMDMGEFYRYLSEHDCGYVFKDYFGVDGKIGSANH